MFVSLYLLLAFMGGEELARACLALALCYGVAFVGVVAEWFWARWFATGLAWSGLMIAGASLVMMGWSPVLAIFGGVHGLVVLALMGKKMAARYDLQEAWRKRYSMDEFGVARLQKTVTRAAASLPSMIFWALGPREDGMTMVAGLAAVLLAAAGLRGLVRLRTWGVMALAACGGRGGGDRQGHGVRVHVDRRQFRRVPQPDAARGLDAGAGVPGRGGAAVLGRNRPLPAPPAVQPLGRYLDDRRSRSTSGSDLARSGAEVHRERGGDGDLPGLR